MTNPKRFAVTIPPRCPGQPQNIGGQIFGTRPDFPESQAGGVGFVRPSLPSPDAEFDDIVTYYVNLVGSSLECLNGLQFDLTVQNKPIVAQKVSDELANLADALNVGSPDNPCQLLWPLAGLYTLNQDLVKMPLAKFDKLVVELYFENEPDFRMVVNCEVSVTASLNSSPSPQAKVLPTGKRKGSRTPQGILAESLTSSSSYIATGSKGG